MAPDIASNTVPAGPGGRGIAIGLQRCGALEEQDQQRSDALLGAAPPHREQRVVHQRFFVRGEPGHVEAHGGRAAVDLPQRVALEHAEAGRGERVHPVGCGVAHLLLHAHEITRQQKGQDLAPTVAQGLVAKRPALQQGVERRIGLPFVDQGLARFHAQGAALERLHQLQLFGRVVNEQRQGPQWAFGARHGGGGGLVRPFGSVLRRDIGCHLFLL